MMVRINQWLPCIRRITIAVAAVALIVGCWALLGSAVTTPRQGRADAPPTDINAGSSGERGVPGRSVGLQYFDVDELINTSIDMVSYCDCCGRVNCVSCGCAGDALRPRGDMGNAEPIGMSYGNSSRETDDVAADCVIRAREPH